MKASLPLHQQQLLSSSIVKDKTRAHTTAVAARTTLPFCEWSLYLPCILLQESLLQAFTRQAVL